MIVALYGLQGYKMTTFDEYRGTKEFYRVLSKSIEAAERKGILYYKEVAELLPGVPL